jgi:type I restriction-modification system DNA methylase subunit
LKDLFWCINTGETENYPYDIFGYNGGLFAQDPILSEAELPDDLFTRDYEVGEDTINGVFGFYTYDFRDDLNEFVIGRIFEESITDFEQIHASILQGDEPFVEAEARDDYGVFFTREGLTEFIAGQVMDDILRERRENIREELGVASDSERIANDVDFLRAYLDEILNMRVADLSCGSGAFLVSCFSRLQQEAETVHEKLKRATETEQSTLEFEALVQREREIIEGCLHGNDLLQEAIEISKLSVWVRSARKEVSLGMLTGNFASKDALAGEVVFDDGEETTGFGDFDLVIGNPPWGGERSDTAEGWLADQFDGFDTENLDTYELFMLVGLRYLNEDGRLAFVLPQTILRPDHEAIREHLLENYTFERFHMMGADWFGSEIRMNTVTVQLKNDPPAGEDTFRSMTLVDEDRRDAITGNLSLKQLEAAYSFDIPQ